MTVIQPPERVEDVPADGPAVPPRWRMVRASRASDEIVAQLRAALFDGRLRPGDALGSEMDLARQFGVSRITVRDAIRTLEARGMVEVRAGARGGARVARGDPDRFADALAIQLKLVGIHETDVYEAQEAIECVTAELAAGRATPADLAELRGLLADAEALLDEPGPFTERALDFHLAVGRASHNRALYAALKALREVQTDYYTPHTTRAVADRVMATHRAILKAIAGGDGPRARALMEEHIQQVRRAAGEPVGGASRTVSSTHSKEESA